MPGGGPGGGSDITIGGPDNGIIGGEGDGKEGATGGDGVVVTALIIAIASSIQRFASKYITLSFSCPRSDSGLQSSHVFNRFLADPSRILDINSIGRLAIDN
jgi:hypothetical protein